MYVDFFFFKQKTAYEMRISDWSSDVCSSDLVEEPTIAVHADRVRLEQVLINLLQNAAEALRGTDGARVTLLAHGDGPVLIDICDNGPGVPADILPQLFTPFVTGRPDGMGLGRAIASDLMRGFGGTLTLVRSPLGGERKSTACTP